jgi:DNA polymerase-3 subunit gamma/tau
VLSVFGLVAHQKMAALTDALIDGDTSAALKILKDLDEVGKDLQRLLADVLDHFRNILVMTLGGEGAELLDLPETELELVKKQGKRIDSDAVLRMIDALAAAEGRLRYALSKRILFEIALVKAIKARQMVGIEGVLKKLNELKGQTGSRGSDMPVATEAAETAQNRGKNTSPPTASLEEAWGYAVEHLGKVTPLAKSYLVGTRPLGMKANVLTVGFDPEFADRREFVDRPRNIELLQSKLKEKLRMDVTLKLEVSEGTMPALPKSTTASKTQASETSKKSPDDFKDDPLIKKALEIFKGTIVDVRK